MFRRSTLLPSAALVLAIALAGALGAQALASAAPDVQGVGAQASGITVEWLGWSHYRLTSPSGRVVVTNPRIAGNAESPITLEEGMALRTDVIVVADLHADELGATIEIAQATGARVVTPAFESGTWLAEVGVPRPQLSFTSPGEVDRHEGITVRVLNSVHGSSPPRASESVWYGGPAASFMITFENGYTVYFAGSSAATLDMGMWAEMYQPDAAIVHQGSRHEPRDAAMVVRLMTANNPNLRTIFPHHHLAQPPAGQLTPADLRGAIQQLGLNVTFIEPEIGRPYTLTK
jgi:L-ascorbate metabolism protein UlaG (beta-lactamase superfamily)